MKQKMPDCSLVGVQIQCGKTQGVFRESSGKFANYASDLVVVKIMLKWSQERQYPHWNSDHRFIFAGLWLYILSLQNKIWEKVLVKPLQLSTFILYHLKVKNIVQWQRILLELCAADVFSWINLSSKILNVPKYCFLKCSSLKKSNQWLLHRLYWRELNWQRFSEQEPACLSLPQSYFEFCIFDFFLILWCRKFTTFSFKITLFL